MDKELNIDENERQNLLRTQILTKTDINPDNPWGHNSYLLLRQRKIMRKYKKIMDYVDLDEQD